jgi:hypothetical protein
MSSRLAPTVAARTLDVTATGEAGSISTTRPALEQRGDSRSRRRNHDQGGGRDGGLECGLHGRPRSQARQPGRHGVLEVDLRRRRHGGHHDAPRAGHRAAGNLLDNLDATVSSRFATAGYTAPDNASVAAIKAKTDSLNFTIPGKLDASLYYVNGVAISGLGTDASPWKGP